MDQNETALLNIYEKLGNGIKYTSKTNNKMQRNYKRVEYNHIEFSDFKATKFIDMRDYLT